MRSDDGGPFVFLNTVGKRVFVDETIPEGVGPMTYQITGIRSITRGNPAQFTVRLGLAGNDANNNTAENDTTDLNLAA